MKMFGSPENCFQNGFSKLCSWGQYFQTSMSLRFQEDVRALLLLDSSPVHLTELLFSEDGRIKCMFFSPLLTLQTLIQPMNWRDLSCKRLYRWKQLEESLVISWRKWWWTRKREKVVSKIKVYSSKEQFLTGQRVGQEEANNDSKCMGKSSLQKGNMNMTPSRLRRWGL